MSNLRTEHEIEIDRIHDRQLAEKDAEIARLTEQAMKFRDMCLEKDKLITECADALEEEFGESRDLMQSQQRPWNLIQRAREVTHGR